MVEFHDFLQQLKQPEYIHVLLNPIPVSAMSSGILALIIALILRSRLAKMTAPAVVIFAAVSLWPFGVYGERGYDRVYPPH